VYPEAAGWEVLDIHGPMNAALAAEAASEQGKFEEMFHILFERQAEWGEQQDSQADVFRGYAEELGLDMAAYDKAGSIDGLMGSAYLFHSTRISQVIQGSNEVIDLGCGPAVQLCQIAQLNPEVMFHGVDLSSTMLDKARANVARLGLTNVRFSQGDITALDFIADASVDGVVSTMALHHLPTLDHLRRCFRGVNRILRPGGALYLVDFTRLKRLTTVIFFAYQNARHQPHLFTLDYERSLRAAFEQADFKAAVSASEFTPQNLAN